MSGTKLLGQPIEAMHMESFEGVAEVSVMDPGSKDMAQKAARRFFHSFSLRSGTTISPGRLCRRLSLRARHLAVRPEDQEKSSVPQGVQAEYFRLGPRR